MNNTPFNTSQVNDLIRGRRTIKPESFVQPVRVIDSNIVETLLENANWAPTHGMNEPWRFKIFAGESRQKLGGFLANWYKENKTGDNFKEAKYQKILNRPNFSSHVIAICMERKSNTKIPEIEDIEAVACAVQNIHLTATAYGIGGYWSSGGATYTDDMKEALGLGINDKCLGFFYLGYPKEGAYQKASETILLKRTSYTNKVEWL
ncbi:MAG: nitroreductase family protein [Chitinophagales bacterium]